MAKVEIIDVHKNYGGVVEAVKGISFTCHDGEFLVLLGPSGCGKTTTLRMITGLETITKGIIKIDDKVVNKLSPRDRNVAMAFETYALYPPLTVYDNIAFPLQVMKINKKEIRKRVESVADALSITDILDSYPHSLAGGQKQRVSLARALVRKPTVFLMDEPLSHVDADVRYRARTEIKHMQAVSNATVIYVTHDQVEAVALADSVVVMDLGVIQQIGTPDDLYYYPANLFVAGFIGEPPMNTFNSMIELTEGELILHWHSDDNLTLRYPVSEISQSAADKLQAYNGKEVVVGIRPQRLRILPSDKDATYGSLVGELVVHEYLGKEGIAQVVINNEIFECVTEPDIPFPYGANVGLAFNFEDLHFFDTQTTKRIYLNARENGNISS
jgi:multiple sugar transport system ATP-binding protein